MCSDNSCTSWRNFLKPKIYFCSENLLDGAQQIVTWGKSRKKKVVLDLLKLSTQTSTHTQELFYTDWPLQNLNSLSSATQGSFWRKHIPVAEYSLLSNILVWENKFWCIFCIHFNPVSHTLPSPSEKRKSVLSQRTFISFTCSSFLNLFRIHRFNVKYL